MKIGILSDSHDNIPMVKLILEKMKDLGVEELIHAGDIISPFLAPIFGEYSFKSHFLLGNNDGEKYFLKTMFEKVGTFSEDYLKIAIDKRQVVAMHKPFFIDEIAESQKYDLIIYGHTHKWEIREVGKTLIVNPGESCGYLSGKVSFAVYDTELHKVEIISID